MTWFQHWDLCFLQISPSFCFHIRQIWSAVPTPLVKFLLQSKKRTVKDAPHMSSLKSKQRKDMQKKILTDVDLAVQDLTFELFLCSLPFDHSFFDVMYGEVAVQPPAMSSFCWGEEIATSPRVSIVLICRHPKPRNLTWSHSCSALHLSVGSRTWSGGTTSKGNLHTAWGWVPQFVTCQWSMLPHLLTLVVSSWPCPFPTLCSPWQVAEPQALPGLHTATLSFGSQWRKRTKQASNDEMSKRTNKPTNQPTNHPTNQPTDKQTNQQTKTNERTNKQTNKPTNERTNKQTNKQTNRQTDRQTKKKANKQANKERKKQKRASKEVCFSSGKPRQTKKAVAVSSCV